MIGEPSQPCNLRPTDLMRLPASTRRRLLADAATKVEAEYASNKELTDFEAFALEAPDN